jgi:hypothetical protein
MSFRIAEDFIMLALSALPLGALPFTREQFVAVFADYNNALWPMQLVAYLLGAIMLVVLVRAPRPANNTRDYIIGSGLAAMWIWAGIAYHGFYFSTINTAAFFFAALFVLQAVLLLYFTIRGRLMFTMAHGFSRWLGWAFIIYAMVIYPLVGMWSGHRYPELPMFGVTPCPVTIFTVGLFVLAQAPLPRWLLVIPFFWSVIGGSAVIVLGVSQDWPLVLCLIAIPFMVVRDRKFPELLIPKVKL